MGIKVRIDSGKVRKIDKKVMTALEKTAEAVKTDVIQQKVIPFDTGTMQNESTFIDSREIRKGKVSIVTDTPYARRLYFHPEFKFKKDKNSNAKGEWFKDYVDGSKKEFVRKVFKRFYEQM